MDGWMDGGWKKVFAFGNIGVANILLLSPHAKRGRGEEIFFKDDTVFFAPCG